MMMKIEHIKTNKAPDAIGPYSQAIRINNIVYTSGQIPLDPITQNVVAGGIEEQTRQCLENLQEILHAAGTGLEYVVKTTVFLKDMSDFQTFNKMYSKYFNNRKPARSCVEISKLPKDVLVEIEAVAFVVVE
jgi:2-iminobutanoate/2-iminopropanoate deaminase